MISLKWVFKSKACKWILFSFASLTAVRFYYVQEMIAAMAMFSILFALAATAALMLFLVDRASQRTLAWAEPHITHAAHAARRVWALAVELNRKLLHYPKFARPNYEKN